MRPNIQFQTDVFFWEINYVANQQYFLKRSNSRLSTRELWNLDDYYSLDKLPNTFTLEKELGDAYYTEFDDYWLSVSQTSFAVAYFFINWLEFGKIKNGKLKLNGFVGVTDAPDFYLFEEAKPGGKYKYNVDNNVVYYEALASTPEGVYALYSGVPWGDLEKKHSSIIEFYNWEGKPIKQFILEEPLSDFVVDENRKLIYGINPDSHEDAILVFKYNDWIEFAMKKYIFIPYIKFIRQTEPHIRIIVSVRTSSQLHTSTDRSITYFRKW